MHGYASQRQVWGFERLASLSQTPPFLGALPNPQVLQFSVVKENSSTTLQRCQPTAARTPGISRGAANHTFCGTVHFQTWEQTFLGTEHVLQASGLPVCFADDPAHTIAHNSVAGSSPAGEGRAPSFQLPSSHTPPTPQKPDLNVLTTSWYNLLEH